MEKQVEFRKKAFMDGVIFLSGMGKQKMSLTRFLGGLSLPKKSYFNRFKIFTLHGQNYYPFVYIHYVQTKS